MNTVFSILLDNDHHGMNLGSELIRCATNGFFNDTWIEKVPTYIRITNEHPLGPFLRAGYISDGHIKRDDEMAHQTIISRCV